MKYQTCVRRLFAIVPLMSLLLSACQPITAPAPIASDTAVTARAAASPAVGFEAISVTCPDGDIVLSDSPFIAGTGIAEVSQVTDAQDFSVSTTYSPAAFTGSAWIALGRGFDAPDGSVEIFASGNGTGELAGSRIIFHATSAASVENLPCEPFGPVLRLEGVIVSDQLEMPQVLATEYVDYDISCPDGNVVISDEPLSIGRSEVEVIPDPDHNYLTINATVFPDAYPGSSWVSPGHGVGTANGGFLIIHSGRGTGELEGAKTLYVVTPAEDLAELPCEPDGPVVKSEGVYILPVDPK